MVEATPRESSRLQNLSRWLAPPVFEDEALNLQASLLNGIVLVLFVSFGLLGLLSLFQPTRVWSVWFSFYVPVLLFHVVVLGLLRSGRIRQASWSYVLFLMASAAGIMVPLGGITAQSFGAFICIALIAGLTIGGREGIALALLGAAISGVFVLAEAQEMLPEQVIFVSPLDYWAGMALNLVAAATLVHIALRRLNRALSVAEASRLESRTSLETLRATQAANYARAAQGAALGQLGQELVRFSDLESLCDRVVGTILELLEVEQAFGFRLMPDGNTLTKVGYRGDLDADWPDDLLREGASELKQALEGGFHAHVVRRSRGGGVGAAALVAARP